MAISSSQVQVSDQELLLATKDGPFSNF